MDDQRSIVYRSHGVPPTEQLLQRGHNIGVQSKYALLFAKDLLVHDFILSRKCPNIQLDEVSSLASSQPEGLR